MTYNIAIEEKNMAYRERAVASQLGLRSPRVLRNKAD